MHKMDCNKLINLESYVTCLIHFKVGSYIYYSHTPSLYKTIRFNILCLIHITISCFWQLTDRMFYASHK